MNKEIKSFLGTGWSFPPVFSKFSNSIQMVSEEQDIEESIRIILNTFPGERVMQPEFGCYLKRLVFEKVDASLITQINDVIARALLNFEPRIKFINSEVLQRDDMEGVLMIRIHYSIIITNTRHNIVYPFYFTEGTNVQL
ncbi:MAG: GPW/gp25 family protein [Chitinophagaceae bacterium]|jgi:phage baseplate assembly protein W|nr:GPW/gp25 family protein [Chitinophagaceae bacterium]